MPYDNVEDWIISTFEYETSLDTGFNAFYKKENGRIMVKHLHVYDQHLVNGELPFQIDACHTLSIHAPKIKSFKNFPKSLNTGVAPAGSSLFFSRETTSASNSFHHISSLEGITPDILGTCSLICLPNINFSHVNSHIKNCSRVTIYTKYCGPLLSFLKIEKLQNVASTMFPGSEEEHRLSAAIEIVNKYLSTSRNISACQTELLRNGLKEFAKL